MTPPSWGVYEAQLTPSGDAWVENAVEVLSPINYYFIM